MTLDEAMAQMADKLDQLIEEELRKQEAEMLENLVKTSRPDTPPAAPGSPWRRITVREAMEQIRARMMSWRDETLATMRAEMEAYLAEDAVKKG